MDTVAPDIAKKLLTRDFANLVQRVQRGGKLNRAERSMLQGMAAGAGGTPVTVQNFVELATALGVTRRTLQSWRKRKDAPPPASNGTHDVAAWREFMRRHDLHGDAPATDEESALRARKLLAEVEDRELRVAIKKQLYVSVEEVRHTWTTLVGRATSLLRNKFENELPPILSGHDATGIQAECRKAIDEVLNVLHSHDGVPAA